MKLKPRGIDKPTVIGDLRRIPGVGPSIAEDLWNIGIRAVVELKDGDPDDLYRRICVYQGCQVDRCMLYVMLCAVYFASNETHDAELLKWWKWKEPHAASR